MTSELRKFVYDSCHVKPPFATRSLTRTCLFTENDTVISFNDSIIVKYTVGDNYYDDAFKEALRGRPTDYDEAKAELEVTLRTFMEKTFSGLLTSHQ